MVRKNKTYKSNDNKQTRDNSSIANRRRLRSANFDKSLTDYNNRFVEDRRTYTPAPLTPKTRTGQKAAIVTTTTRPKQNNSRKVDTFNAPQEVITCVRRKQRKEVMHAMKKSGKSGQRKPRRNQLSNTHCK